MLTQQFHCVTNKSARIVCFYNTAPEPEVNHVVFSNKLWRHVSEGIHRVQGYVSGQGGFVGKLAI